MNRFALLAVAALASTLAACSHSEPAGYVYTAPETVTTSSSTSSVQNQCVNEDGVQLSPAECTAMAQQLKQKTPIAGAAVAPGAAVTTTGHTCKTVNGVTQCVNH